MQCTLHEDNVLKKMVGRRRQTGTFFACFVFSLMCITSVIRSEAKEGMWIPATLMSREANLKMEGLQIPVSEIYNEQGTGLNNAIVLFGRGCTGELISGKGLILTNHHCGYGSAQRLSSADKDYFSYGFWAMNTEEELPCPGLTVTFIRRMSDVTERIVKGLADTLNDKTRDSTAMSRITEIEAEYHNQTGLDATVKPFYQSNRYWVILSETYTDVRLVGFPPNGIGKFGGDDENWAWPRHTGDFSLFRVYAGTDNKSAAYNKNNKPLESACFLPVSASGVKEGDFTMVYGFPGTTDEYAYSGRLRQVTGIIDPIAIQARTQRLNVWNQHSDADRSVFLKYTAKNAGIANGWKKWRGELEGLELNHVMDKKIAYEKKFQLWATKQNDLPFAHDLLKKLKEETGSVDTLMYMDMYNRETVMGIEVVQQAAALDKILGCLRAHLSDSVLSDTLKKALAQADGFYKNYDAGTDKDEFKTLMALYFTHMQGKMPLGILQEYNRYNSDFSAWANAVYDRSFAASSEKLKQLSGITPADSTRILTDPAWIIWHEVTAMNAAMITSGLSRYSADMKYLNRLYLEAQMKFEPKKNFYPDANLTLRLTYGKVAAMSPTPKTHFPYRTTLDDVIAVDNPGKEDFKVPEKLKELYRKKDFGRWADNGKVPVAFIAANHTSGGNSGSPVLNAKGELIGLNFDRAYEGTMSDYYFDPARCRNISVDIRYVLFIVEKFGGAGWLLNEMKLVK